MKITKPYKKKKQKGVQMKEPQAQYSSIDENKRIRFFSSFEEENEFVAKERASLTYNERMFYAEELRKRIFNSFLLPDDSWQPVAKVFKIMPPYTNEAVQ